MKRGFIFFLALALLFPQVGRTQDRGDLASDSLVLLLSKSEILAIYDTFGISEFFFPIRHEVVELHRIVYYTLNGRGDGLTLASGLAAFPPDTTCTFPLLNYSHGSLAYDEALSDFRAKMAQHFIGVPFAANGYVAALPDFLGYGATPPDHPHPYIHAKSEATSVVDMLRAVRTLCAGRNIQLNDKLFLLGYSQGGHVTMATHREIESLHADEFTVTASAPCSGPYDLSGILFDSTFYSTTFSNAFFIAFGTASYQYIYQNLYSEINEIFQPPYDSMILRMLDRRAPESNLRDSLPAIGIQMFQPDYLAEILADSLHPLREDIRDNDVYDWKPEAPVRLYYCTQDEQIPYVNALFTADHMADLGANVEAFNAGPFDHFACTPWALLAAKFWFDGFHVPCSVGTEDLAGAEPVRIFPNPFQRGFTVLLPGPYAGALWLTDMLGRTVYSGGVQGEQQIHLPADLPPGAYLARIQSESGTTLLKLVKQ